MIKILLVDDHPSVREGTKMIIESGLESQVCVCSSSNEAIELTKKNYFDIYILDLNLQESNGILLTKDIISINENATILILTGYDIEPHFDLLVEAGISGFINKTASSEQLVNAIQCALRGETILPTVFFKQLRRTQVAGKAKTGRYLDIQLTAKERDILIELSKGKTTQELAKQFLMSKRMIEYHLTSIFHKLEVKSRGEAIHKARELKMIPDLQV